VTGNDERGPLVLQAAAPRAIEWATQTIVEGGVVAIPTDTVYGIAASIFSEPALDRVYAIKGRDRTKSLPVLVSSLSALERLTEPLDVQTALLLNRFWPGPLTVVLPARPGLEEFLTAEDGTIGVRMPNHPLALEIIDRAGGAIACTSANRSGETPGCNAREVAATLGADIDLTLDGGITSGGVPSTVVALRGNRLVLLREGAIAREEIEAAWNEVSAIDE
jgi:L-threonylcarbamoyladenylate synthase